MPALSDQLTRLALQQGVIQFGEYQLKSGRTSPYFFDLGRISSANAMKQLADLYAQCIYQRVYPEGIDFDVLLGPAYKGIPIATATSLSLSHLYQRDVRFAFNRKEPKTHGEGGVFMGAPITGRILLIDDVITAGTAVKQVLSLISQHPDASVVGLVVSFDRQERANDEPISAIQALTQSLGIPVYSIATFTDLMNLIAREPNWCTDAHLSAIKNYWQVFGVQ